MFISLQYGLDVHPAFCEAIDVMHEAFPSEEYDVGITLSYCGL